MAGERIMAGGAGHGSSPDQLMRRARLELDAADSTGDPQMRFLHAHMAAIRSAAALVTTQSVVRRRRRVLSVWEQLTHAGSDWETWAAHFAAGAPLRAAIESGRAPELGDDVADAAVRDASVFLDDVEAWVRSNRASAVASIAS